MHATPCHTISLIQVELSFTLDAASESYICTAHALLLRDKACSLDTLFSAAVLRLWTFAVPVCVKASHLTSVMVRILKFKICVIKMA